MKKIPLTQGQFAIVDDWWFVYLMKWNWIATWDNHTKGFYAVRREGKALDRKLVHMSRVIAKTPDGMWCDHINHNTLMNTEENLRNVTNSQNQMNKRIRRDNTTGVAGVGTRKKNGKYIARVRIQKKNVFYKEFKTIEEATQARKEAEKKYFGEFANK